MRVTKNFCWFVKSSNHKKLKNPRSKTNSPPTGTAAMISVANRLSLAAASSVYSCHRGRWLKASTMTIILPPSTSPSRAQDLRLFAQRFEGRTINKGNQREALPHRCPARVRHGGRHLRLQPCTDFRQELAHHCGRQHVEPFGDGLGTNTQRRNP